MVKTRIKPRSFKIGTNYEGHNFKTINPNEAIILSHLPSKWKWIARDKDGSLGLYAVKPKRELHSDVWQVESAYLYMPFPYGRMFKSIKWRDMEPINIDRLLRDNLE